MAEKQEVVEIKKFGHMITFSNLAIVYIFIGIYVVIAKKNLYLDCYLSLYQFELYVTIKLLIIGLMLQEPACITMNQNELESNLAD